MPKSQVFRPAASLESLSLTKPKPKPLKIYDDWQMTELNRAEHIGQDVYCHYTNVVIGKYPIYEKTTPVDPRYGKKYKQIVYVCFQDRLYVE
jgi:hypothetical protein